MTIAHSYNLQTADVLISPKSTFGLIHHFVVFEGIDSNGVDWYIENNQYIGVRRINGATFQNENTIQEIRRFQGNDIERRVAISRGVALIGRPYSLLKFNCEHFANHVQFNTPISIQVNNFKKGLAVAAFTTAVIGLASLFND